MPWRYHPLSSQAVSDALQRRRQAGRLLIEQADAFVRAGLDMARNFHRNGRLIAFGNGASDSDARHIAVEFVHPVIMGKHALPAIALGNDSATPARVGTRQHETFAHQIRALARPEDIAIGLCLDGQCHDVYRALQIAREMGLLTIALVGRHDGLIRKHRAVDHLLEMPADAPLVVKELHVTCYHILWELVHVFFAHPQLLETGSKHDATT